MKLKRNPLLTTLVVISASAAIASAQTTVFFDDFENGANDATVDDTTGSYSQTPDVDAAQSDGNTSGAVNSTLWVKANQGFGSTRQGLVDESHGDFTDPVGEQAWAFRYTNSGLTTAEGVIGPALAGVTYTVTFDVVEDGHNSTTPYTAQLGTFNGAARNDARSDSFFTKVLASTSGNAPAGGAYQSVNFSYTVDPAADASVLGHDVVVRFKGATSSAIIDNVKVEADYSALAYWDTDGTTPGSGGTTPSGTWDAVTANWNTLPDGTDTTAAWTPGLTAVFAAGSDATGAYTVTVDGSQDITGLFVEEGSPTLADGTSGALNMTADTSVLVESGTDLTVEIPLTDATGAEALTKLGDGTLILNADNSGATGGMDLSAGVTRFESPASINGTGENVTLELPGTMAFGSSFGTGTDVITALTDRVDTSSTGTVAADNYAATDFDFATLGFDAYLGAVGNVTYSGTLTPNGSIYRLGGGGGALALPSALPVDSDVAIKGPGSVQLNGNSWTLDALTGAAGGTLENANASPVTLTVGNANASSTYSGDLADGTGGGALALDKTGTGTLTLRGTNTHTGGTTISNGNLNINAGSNVGADGVALTFDTSASLIHGGSNDSTIDLGARPITLNNNAIATFDFGRGKKMTTTGAVTGTGGVALKPNGGNAQELNLLSTSNTFTGPVTLVSGSDRPYLTVNSLADGASPIELNDGGGRFRYGSGALVALTLDNRPVTIADVSAFVDNLSGFPMTINSSVTATGTGNATLNLSGGNGGTINADIDEVDATLGLGISNFWSITGTNTISGTTTLNSGGTLEVLGTPAAPTGDVVMFKNTTLRLRTDDVGTVNLGNNLVAQRNDNSTGIIQNYTIDVANNGGATTDSTVVFGNMDFTVGDMRPPRQFNTEGANGYSVQVGDVILTTEIQGITGGAQRIRSNTAPIEITGTVKQIDGNSGTRPNANSLYLGGTGTGNLVSGTIDDADDYPTNPNAAPLDLFKGDAGEWTLAGINTYSGNTTINGGILRVNGSIGAGAVAVIGGSLGGSGSVGGTVTVASGGGLIPGASAGTLSIGGDLDISGPAADNLGSLDFELDAVGASDTIAVTGTLTIGSGLLGLADFTFTDLGGLQNGTYTLISSGAPVSGTLDGADTNGTLGSATIDLQISGSGTDIELVVSGLAGGSPFDTWAGTGTLGPVTFEGDTNGDGVQDGMAFLLGVANPDDDANGALPIVSEDGSGNLVMVFDCLPTGSRGTAELRVAHSNTLASFTATVDQVPDADDVVPDNNVTFVVTGPSGSPSVNNVTATIDAAAAAGGGKLFGRLEATE